MKVHEVEERRREREKNYEDIIIYLKSIGKGKWVTGTAIQSATGVSTDIIGVISRKRQLSIQSLNKYCSVLDGYRKFYRLHPTLDAQVHPQIDIDEVRAAKLARVCSSV